MVPVAAELGHGAYRGIHATVAEQLDLMWVVICTILVLSMQFGFAMLEVGSCRRAHRMTVLTKNVMDSAVSCLAFWLYCVVQKPPLIMAGGEMKHHLVVFHFSFCATSVTICSGAMGERTHMLAYICYACVMAGLIYPVAATAAWDQGSTFLPVHFPRYANQGYKYHDLAGSGVVHLVGGAAALVGNALLGRRIMWPQKATEDVETVGAHEWPSASSEEQPLPISLMDEQPLTEPEGGWPRRFDNKDRDRVEFAPVNYLQAMGMFTLWVGWYGFNAGSMLTITRQNGFAASIVAWNSTVAASAGGLGAALYSYLVQANMDISTLCNGVISGLVAITANCDVATPVLAACIGGVAGLLVFPLANACLQCLWMDDPPSAIGVHAACGLFGVVVTAFCKPDCDLLASIGGGTAEQARFCEPGHNYSAQLAMQLWGAFMLTLWTSSVSLVFWLTFAISEVIRSFEASALQELDVFLEASIVRTPGETDPAPELRKGCLDKCSPAVLRLMREHGWKGNRFQDPVDLSGLRTQVRCFREHNIDTALEVNRSPLLRRVSHFLHWLPLFWRFAVLRLRISPAAELSGLGHANLSGGRLFKAVHIALSMQEENNKSRAELEQQVKELASIIQSQDTVLQAVNKRKGGGYFNSPPSRSSASTSFRSNGGASRSGEFMSPTRSFTHTGSELSLDDSCFRLPTSPTRDEHAALKELSDQVAHTVRAQQDFLARLHGHPTGVRTLPPRRDSPWSRLGAAGAVNHDSI